MPEPIPVLAKNVSEASETAEAAEAPETPEASAESTEATATAVEPQVAVDVDAVAKINWLVKYHGIQKGADLAAEAQFMAVNPAYDPEAEDADPADAFLYRPASSVATEPVSEPTGSDADLKTLIKELTNVVKATQAAARPRAPVPFGLANTAAPAEGPAVTVTTKPQTLTEAYTKWGDGWIDHYSEKEMDEIILNEHKKELQPA